jgi:hypothetical protein
MGYNTGCGTFKEEIAERHSLVPERLATAEYKSDNIQTVIENQKTIIAMLQHIEQRLGILEVD